MLLTLASFAFAAELAQDHPTTYTVKKGDTLWDISARFLKQPWLWPEIWQANPQVKNPHLIYPGDVLSLVYVNGEPRIEAGPGPQVRESDAIETVPLSQIEPFLKQLTVVQDPKSFPYVVGLEEDRLLTGAGQVVYVRGMANAAPGMKVQLARPISYYAMGKTVRDGRRWGGLTPVDFRGNLDHIHWGYGDNPTEAIGEKLGYEMMMHSHGEVTRVQGDVAVVLLQDENREVRVGDRVLPVEAEPYCNCFQPHAAPTGAGAQVLAVADGLKFSGPRIVIALNVGSRDGVDNGTTFSIWHEGALRGDVVAHRSRLGAMNDRVQMPDDYLGHAMVFRTFEKVSYALVMDGIRPVRVGDKLKAPNATQ